MPDVSKRKPRSFGKFRIYKVSSDGKTLIQYNDEVFVSSGKGPTNSGRTAAKRWLSNNPPPHGTRVKILPDTDILESTPRKVAASNTVIRTV